MNRATYGFVLVLVLVARAGAAQQDIPPRGEEISLSGPRFGMTVLTGEGAQRAKDDFGVNTPVLSQFGWQFERRFLSSQDGLTGVFEWVLLVGGLEQGVFFPSVTWITGIRTPSGLEFGAGPNITPLSVGLAVGAGVNLQSGHMNFPLNAAIVSSGSGVRTSVLGGFTMRR
jgi:hypothetical protein